MYADWCENNFITSQKYMMHGIYTLLHKTEADAKWFHDNAFYPTPLPFLSLRTITSLSCFASNETPPHLTLWCFLFFVQKFQKREEETILRRKRKIFMIHCYIYVVSVRAVWCVWQNSLYRIAIFAFHCTLIQLSSSFYYFITLPSNVAFFIHEKFDILKSLN